MVNPDVVDEKAVAAVDMLRRTGAADLQIRYSDDEQPVVWFAVAQYRWGNGRPQPTGPVTRWETAAGHNPTEALLRLCERVIDGAQCVHCGRPSMFLPDVDETKTPLDRLVCEYEWDPELSTFRRACEGSQ